MVSHKKVMEQTRSELLKNVLKVILILALFTSFLVFYFIKETSEYLKGSTTFASRTEEVDKFNLPVLVICFEPSYKPSIFGDESADFSYLFDKEDFIKEKEKLADALHSASYKLNEDVQIEFVVQDDNTTDNYTLKDGQNLMDNFQVDVYKIYTLTHGSCYVIENTKKVDSWVTFQVYVKDLNSKNVDKLSGLVLFVASPETWYGIITLSWPYFELKQHSLGFNMSKQYWIDMLVTNVTYIKNGQKSIEGCIEKLMATNAACKKCLPFFFSFKNKKISCQSKQENKCWYYWSFMGKNYNKYKRCLKPMKTTLYNAELKLLKKAVSQPDTVDVIFSYSSDQIKIKEATLMIGTSSYIGSIGGSLGLFLGFSFFTYLSSCIDKLFKLCY